MLYGVAAVLAAVTFTVSGPVYVACDGYLPDSRVTIVTERVSYGRDEDDLINKEVVSVSDMELLIDRYVTLYPDSALKDCAGAFIEASNQTGMDPIFFFSLCGIESGWGTSQVHIKQGNPYSLGMYGDGVHNGYDVGDTFYAGIVEGANYIYENYYCKGQTTLYSMNHQGDHSYCAEDSEWERQIEEEMAYCKKLLAERL